MRARRPTSGLESIDRFGAGRLARVHRGRGGTGCSGEHKGRVSWKRSYEIEQKEGADAPSLSLTDSHLDGERAKDRVEGRATEKREMVNRSITGELEVMVVWEQKDWAGEMEC